MSVTVLYIGGSGRSGSTLLDNMLGQLDGFVSVGELRYLWERGLLDDRPCGCGKPFSECELWRAVLDKAWPDGAPEPRGMMRVMGRHVRTRHLLGILRRARRRQAGPLDDYEQALDRLYSAVADVTGARVIVDSSKLPPYGAVVQRLPSVRFAAVQLVRDPRATAYSWRRTKALPDYDGQRNMQQQAPWRSAWLWMMWNSVAAYLWRPLGDRYLRLSYERLVSSPREAVMEAAAVAGEQPVDLPFTGPTTMRLRPTHSVAGNPSRFSHGTVELRPDAEWVRSMRRGDALVVTALTWPLLRRYGYRLRRPRG